MDEDKTIVYNQIGGEAPLRRLVDEFYKDVEDDPILRPLYPGRDLGPAKERLALFLIQRFGGPTTYSDRRGHPRLRMRHAPFSIGVAEKDAWLRHMTGALDRIPELAPHREELLKYFTDSAVFMMNREDPLAPDNGSTG